ncbi:MAG: hypothetical protein AAGA55_09315 [Planctomycetota bacterium]
MDLSFLGDEERQKAALGWLDGIDIWLRMPIGNDESTLRCKTIRDFVTMYRSIFESWYRLTPDAEDEQFGTALIALKSRSPKFFADRLSLDELDRPLLEIFRSRHRFPSFIKVHRCMEGLGRALDDTLPRPRSRLQRLNTERAMLPYVGGMLLLLPWMIGDGIWWKVPTLGWIAIAAYLFTPYVLLLLVSLHPDPPWFEYSEPELTLRDAMLRYADKLQTEHRPEEPEVLEERLISFFWEDGEPKPSLDDLLPWHR